MGARPILGALALVGLGLAFLVGLAVISSGPGSRQASTLEWTIQILVLAGAVLLVAGRIVRRS